MHELQKELVQIFSRSTHRTIGFLVFALMLIGIFITVLLFQQQQSLQQDAAYSRNTLGITQPQNGAQVSGVVTVKALITMGAKSRIASPMSLTVDGAVQSSPTGCISSVDANDNFTFGCEWQWNSTNVLNGSHILRVRMRQGANTFQSSPKQVFVSNTTSLSPTPIRPAPTTQPGDYFITGRVFIDNNRNGKFDTGDQMYAKNARITETVTGKSATSNSVGIYRIDGLYEGVHQVRISVPYGLEATTPTLVTIPVDSNETVNFGLYQTL